MGIYMNNYLRLICALSLMFVFNSCEDPVDEDTTPPGSPLNLVYDANLSGDLQIYLSWEAPLDEDLSAFNIYREPGNGIFVLIRSTTNNFYLDTDLDYLIEYGYKVSALDKNGNESDFSNIVSQVPRDLVAPAAPAGLSYNPDLSGDRQIHLSWAEPINDAVAIYHVYRDSGTGNFSEIGSTADTLYLDTNLDYYIEYSYKVSAEDGAGNISSLSEILSQTAPDLVAPQAPSGFTYDPNLSGDGQIYLTWSTNSDTDGVSIYYIHGDSGSGFFSKIDSTPTPEYLDFGLDYETEYSYKITAGDLPGNISEFSSIVSLTPINLHSPATPNSLMIRAHNIPSEFITNVELLWSANTESDFSHYGVYKSAASALFIPNETTFLDSATQAFYIDDDVVPGATYYYKLVAFDLGGLASDPSMVVSDTPLEIPELIRPINDDTATGLTPTFEWTNIGNAVKYKIVVRTSSQTGDIWEAEVEATSESTINIAYPNNGLPLNANTRYFWFVAGYSQDIEEVNVYSEIETFRTP